MMTNDRPDKQTKDHGQRRQLVSSLADGQLRGLEFARAVDLVSESGDARATWHAYHVVGDVLRSGDGAPCADDAAFVARFQTRLQREIADLAPDRLSDRASDRLPNSVPTPMPTLLPNTVLDTSNAQSAVQNTTNRVADHAYPTRASGTNGMNILQIESANESRFRWKLLAGVASVAAVGAIGWGMVGGLENWDAKRAGEPSVLPQLAQTSPQVQTQAQAQVMIRDPHLDALLAAHKQFGGTSALQMPAGFLRNATFEGAAR